MAEPNSRQIESSSLALVLLDGGPLIITRSLCFGRVILLVTTQPYDTYIRFVEARGVLSSELTPRPS
jgi:hypothetical protein